MATKRGEAISKILSNLDETREKLKIETESSVALHHKSNQATESFKQATELIKDYQAKLASAKSLAESRNNLITKYQETTKSLFSIIDEFMN